MRIRGKIKFNKGNKPIYVQGDTARGSLHQQTFYGAIKRNDEIRYVIRKPLNELQQSDVDKIVDNVVKQKVQDAISTVGFKVAVDNSKHTIWMNEEKRIPISKVRIYATSVTQPIHLKKQRDLSDKGYKQDYHVANDGNYCMVIYEGTDEKGRTKRSYRIITNLEAAAHYKLSSRNDGNPYIAPLSDDNEFPLVYTMKIGTMVLLYNESPDDLYNMPYHELSKRLFKVTKLEKDGRITLKFHQEARGDELISKECKSGYSSFEQTRSNSKLRLSLSKIKMLVEGYDFDLSVSGKITFKH